ncbi:MAG: MFS transporter [Proteobacteria bacterium]|nr:MFS transporter [Pseudomonadota bacterium]
MSVERPYGWVVVAASLVLMAIAAGGNYFVVVALKPIAAEFGWPRWIPSLGYSLSMIGMGAGGILIGRLSDRIGVAWPALAGGIAVAAGAVLVATATGPVQFLLAQFALVGFLGNAAVFSPLLANVTRWFDRRRGLAVAIVANGHFLAGAAWPPLFGALIARAGWREAYAVFALVALAVMVSLSVLLRPRPPVGPAALAGGGGAEGAGGRVLGLRAGAVEGALSLAIVGCCVAMAMPMVHVVSHASDLGHPSERAVELLSVLLGTAFLSRLAWGMLADRIGGLATLLFGSAAQAGALSLYLAVESLAGLYAVSALFGVGFGGILPTYSLIIRDLFPVSEIGRRIGVVYFFGTAGMALGGWIGGGLFDLTGSYRAAFAVGLVFNLINLALVALLGARRRRLAGARAT